MVCLLLSGTLFASEVDTHLSDAKSIAAMSFTGASRYYVKENHLKFLTLGALSAGLTYKTHDRCDVAGVSRNSFGPCQTRGKGIEWSARYKAHRFGQGKAVVLQWQIISLPQQGILYERNQTLAAGDSVDNPDSLAYLPDPGYTGRDSFSYRVRDETGFSAPAMVEFQVYRPDDYSAALPLGIPDPGFGIADTAPPDPIEWTGGVDKAGWYFVDQRSTNCTDDEGAFGNPETPRCGLPSRFKWTIAGGAKMVVRPGEYELGDAAFETIEFEGTADARSWLVGVTDGIDRPLIRANSARTRAMELRLYGGYFTIEGIDFSGIMVHHRLPDRDQNGQPIQPPDAGFKVFRHNSVTDIALTSNGTSLFIGGNPQQPSDGVLVFDNKIARNGLMADDLGQERDVHGAMVQGTNGYWFLENLCFENAGDCLQVNSTTATDVFVGHLKCHSEGENCLDVKSFNGLVVSENDGWDLRKVFYGNSAGFAQVFYLNDEGQQRGEAWFLNNRAWDADGPGVALANVGATAYMLGNQVLQAATGLSLNGNQGKKYALLNSVVNAGVGLLVHSTTANTDHAALNVVVSRNRGSLAVQESSGGTIALLDHNAYVMRRFIAGVGSFRSPRIYRKLKSYQKATGHEKHGLHIRDRADLHEVNRRFEKGLSAEVPAAVLQRFERVFGRPYVNRSNVRFRQ